MDIEIELSVIPHDDVMKEMILEILSEEKNVKEIKTELEEKGYIMAVEKIRRLIREMQNDGKVKWVRKGYYKAIF